jgi:hypothetical protein
LVQNEYWISWKSVSQFQNWNMDTDITSLLHVFLINFVQRLHTKLYVTAFVSIRYHSHIHIITYWLLNKIQCKLLWRDTLILCSTYKSEVILDNHSVSLIQKKLNDWQEQYQVPVTSIDGGYSRILHYLSYSLHQA